MTEWRPNDWIGRGGIIPNAALNPIYKPEYIDEKIREGQLYEAGASAMLSALLKWLDEKCDHRLQSSVGGFFYPDSRRDCPRCMSDLKERNEKSL